MQLTAEVVFEKNPDGTFRKLNGGHIRFTIQFRDTETKEIMCVSHGWRITADGMYVVAPSTITKSGGIFTTATMSTEMQKQVIDAFEVQGGKVMRTINSGPYI